MSRSTDGDGSREHEVDRLIRELAKARRQVTEAELDQIRAHAAQAGFDPRPIAPVGGRAAGVRWRSQMLRGSDRLTAAEVHYLRHVVVQPEWPSGTSPDDYLGSIRQAILDPSSGIFLSIYQGALQVGFVRRAGALRGPTGSDYVLVEYRVGFGHWVTAYQLPLEELTGNPQRSELQWLEQPM